MAIARVRNLLVSTTVGTLIAVTVAAQNALPAYLEIRPVPHGTVQSHAYKSKSLGTDRNVVVYTPPGLQDFLCKVSCPISAARDERQ